jgi:hypothetical protein
MQQRADDGVVMDDIDLTHRRVAEQNVPELSVDVGAHRRTLLSLVSPRNLGYWAGAVSGRSQQHLVTGSN